MRIAILGDTHFGCRNSNRVVEEHIFEFIKKFLYYIKDEGITTVIQTGDFFDSRKSVDLLTLQRVKTEFLDVLKERGVTLHIPVGNHDVFWRHSNELSSPEMLLNKEYPNIHIYSEPTEVLFDNLNVLMMPWINNQNYNTSVDKINSTMATVMVAHLELNGFVMHSGVISQSGMDKQTFSRFDKVITGHFHAKSTLEPIYYVGTPYDTSWADYGDKKYWHILDTKDVSIQTIENPDRLFVKLWYDDTKDEGLLKEDLTKYKDKIIKVIVSNKTNPVMFEGFLDNLNKTNPFEVSIIDDALSGLTDVDEDDILVKTNVDIISQTVYNTDSERINNDKLMSIMLELYDEALTDD